MKKLLSLVLAMIMMFAVSSVAFAHQDDELIHAGSVPATSTKAVTITIKALTDGSGDDPQVRLPSEYHVRVVWDIQNGVYSATASDNATSGFKNFGWNCDILDFYVVEQNTGAGESDPRSANWTTVPRVRFEVTNASTPDLQINATPSLTGDDAWATYLKTGIVAENTAVGTRTIAPVLKDNLGSGKNSYESQGSLWSGAHNTYNYQYVLDWDYDALNAAALAAYKAGNGNVVKTNNFVVTITAAGAAAGN